MSWREIWELVYSRSRSRTCSISALCGPNFDTRGTGFGPRSSFRQRTLVFAWTDLREYKIRYDLVLPTLGWPGLTFYALLVGDWVNLKSDLASAAVVDD